MVQTQQNINKCIDETRNADLSALEEQYDKLLDKNISNQYITSYIYQKKERAFYVYANNWNESMAGQGQMNFFTNYGEVTTHLSVI